jgi:hypothetical protein
MMSRYDRHGAGQSFCDHRDKGLEDGSFQKSVHFLFDAVGVALRWLLLEDDFWQGAEEIQIDCVKLAEQALANAKRVSSASGTTCDRRANRVIDDRSRGLLDDDLYVARLARIDADKKNAEAQLLEAQQEYREAVALQANMTVAKQALKDIDPGELWDNMDDDTRRELFTSWVEKLVVYREKIILHMKGFPSYEVYFSDIKDEPRRVHQSIGSGEWNPILLVTRDLQFFKSRILQGV